MAALAATLEGALIATYQQEDVLSAGNWGAQTPRSKYLLYFQGQFLHPLPHIALLPWPCSPCPSLPALVMLGRGTGPPPSSRGHLSWQQPDCGEGRSGEAKLGLAHSRQSFLFLWLSISSPVSCWSCASRRSTMLAGSTVLPSRPGTSGAN